jgi:hypothetical protein
MTRLVVKMNKNNYKLWGEKECDIFILICAVAVLVLPLKVPSGKENCICISSVPIREAKLCNPDISA